MKMKDITKLDANPDGTPIAAPAGLVRLCPCELKPSPENATLYKPFSPATERDDAKLVESMRAEGFRDTEPIIITADGFILDGHRRHQAALAARLPAVPVIIRQDIRRAASHPADYVRTLAAYNLGTRDKDREEQFREALVDIDPESAHLRLRQRREALLRFDGPAIELPEATRRRKGISEAKGPMLAACNAVIYRLRDFWPLSLRQIHYNLLNDPPLRNTDRRRSHYRNDRESYQDLSDLLTRARLTGQVPIEAINDDTRPKSIWRSWPNASDYMEEKVAGLISGYRRDYMRAQAVRVEIICEKQTVQGVLSPIAYNYGIPLIIGRGWGSLPMKRDIVKRFRDSRKERLILLLVSDLDPDGDGLAVDYPIALRDDFGFTDEEFRAVRVALTPEQVQEFGLPVNGDAEAKASSRKKAFIERHGMSDCYELEAVPPNTLRDLLRAAIESVIDRQAFAEEIEAEKADAAMLEAQHQTLIRALQAS